MKSLFGDRARELIIIAIYSLILGGKPYDVKAVNLAILRFRKIGEHLKLYQTWFCKKRLCPLCNWRKSMKNSSQLKQIIAEAVVREPKSPIA
ncbi:protein rep [Levilactobacillus brevis]